LAGTTVKRATLHNADIIKNLGLFLEDTVFVEKGGEIIPKIIGVDSKLRTIFAKPIVFITKCPECNTPLIKDEGEVGHYCPNQDGCPPQIKGKIEHFISRKAMNIDGLGQETVDLLYSEGLIKNVTDLYKLEKEQIANLERLGDKSAERILKSLEESKSVPFERVLFALGIRFIGETVAKILAKSFLNIENIRLATIDELIDVNEIGIKIAESLVNYFNDPKQIELIEFLKKNELQFELSKEKLENRSEKFNGLNIIISGTFENFSRETIKELIEQNGGKNVSSISKKTNYLIAGENIGPSKLEKAKKLGIPIISEDDFKKMLNG
jgi:DNA ligase (NAD+)